MYLVSFHFCRSSKCGSYFCRSLYNLITDSMEQSPWEANRFSASEEIPAFYETRNSITAFTSARHLSLPWAGSIQSLPQHPASSYISLNGRKMSYTVPETCHYILQSKINLLYKSALYLHQTLISWLPHWHARWSHLEITHTVPENSDGRQYCVLPKRR